MLIITINLFAKINGWIGRNKMINHIKQSCLYPVIYGELILL